MMHGARPRGHAAAASWQALAPAAHPHDIAHLEALARAIGFRPEDLQAHRMGKWSRRERLRRLGIGCAAAASLLIPIAVTVALTTSSVERFAEIVALALPVPLLAFMIIALPALFGTVQAVDGIASLSSKYESEESSTGGSTIVLQHYVNVNGRSFKVTPPTASTIISGRAHRLYVSAWGKRLMSMEPFPVASVAAVPGYPK